MSSWEQYIQESQAYKWAVAGIAWWGAYAIVLVFRWTLDRTVGSPPASIPRVCKEVGLSLLVFEEEHYVHYVHGR
jgi:hypothetical protein